MSEYTENNLKKGIDDLSALIMKQGLTTQSKKIIATVNVVNAIDNLIHDFSHTKKEEKTLYMVLKKTITHYNTLKGDKL